MNKSELVEAVASKTGMTQEESRAAVNAFIDAAMGALTNGEEVTLVGFGSFKIGERKARQGINPQTREKIDIPARRTVRFKAGSKLDDLLRAL